MLDYVLLFLSGLLGGFLAGLLGIGGGLIFVFVLTFYFDGLMVNQVELPRFLIANSIFATFFAALSASLRNRKMGHFEWKPVLKTALPGLFTLLILSYLITEFDWYDKSKFAIGFSVLLLFFLLKMLIKPKTSGTFLPRKETKYWMSIGGVSGIVSAMSGLGGGVLLVPLFTQVIYLPIKKASSISLGVIAVWSFALSLYYIVFAVPENSIQIPNTIGYVVLPAAGSLALGVLVAAPFGASLSKRLSNRLIKALFATLIAIVALKMIASFFW